MAKTREDQFHADLRTRLETIHGMLYALGDKHPAEAGRLIKAIIDDIAGHKSP
ncbi:MAG: hypothetical protein HZB21_05420 [Deltaproteobacteria bacterium]|nr:hypothetical protein [Deltaproteobacteria bacterium]